MRTIILSVVILGFIFNNDQAASVSETEIGPYGNDSVYVNGTDITQKLRTDLNAGLNVDLPSGHFYVSETIIIEGYSGIVKGTGKDSTIVEADSGFKATADPLFPGKKLAEIFAIYFVTGDVTFQDMTIKVTGKAPAERHNNPFVGLVTTIDNGIVVDGTGAVDSVMVTFKNLKIIGEYSNDNYSFRNRNLIYPLIVTGLDGSGSVSTFIENCEIENSGHPAIEYFSPKGGIGEISNNKINSCYRGIWLGQTQPESYVSIKDNIFQNIADNAIVITSSFWNVCINNNTLDGEQIPDDCPATSIPKQHFNANHFQLSQNFPNPFNPSTTIDFTLPKSEFVTLKIYNILGEEIATLVNDKLQAGNHTYQFDGSDLASGVYLYRIESGEFQQVRKMILIR